LIRHAVGFLFESIARLVDAQLGLDDAANCLVADRSLKLQKRMVCSAPG